jgi:ABC-type transport system involved in multi-copper enzyme maturation permease subunit
MRSALGAEWRKLLGHTRAFSFLVLIFPVGALVIALAIGILPGLLIPAVREYNAAAANSWTDDLLLVWTLLSGFPGGTFLQMPFIGFVAIAFAGEYQWGTWKNILPGQSRTVLILSKFIVLSSLILLAILATSLILTGGNWLSSVLFNSSYGPPLAEVDIAVFLTEYLSQILVTFANLLIFAAIAALIAMYSRSVMASLLLTIGVGILEFGLILLLLLVGNILKRPGLVNIFAGTPSYNLENIKSWIVDGVGSNVGGMPGFTAVQTLPVSILIVIGWLVGLLLVTTLLFRRQDINN